MKNPTRFALSIAAGALVASTLLAAAPPQQSAGPQSSNRAADDPAAGLFARMCSDCHDAERVVSLRRTSTDWEDVLKKMIEKGASGSEKEFESVFDYLLRNYGKVFINNAKASDIATILGLTPKDADAIVAYRKTNGNFADFDAVKKVPGIDVKKLEERKEAVAF